MPLTAIDPRTALVVIDMQKGIVSLPLVHPAGQIVDNAARLARAFRTAGQPVVLVNVNGGAPGRTDAGGRRATPPADWADLIAELDRQPTDHLVTKLRWGAFYGTSLDQYLRDLGVTQLVFCGIATSIGVESTARNAYELGYNVVLATDAMSDMDPEAHRNSVERIFPRLGETASTEAIIGQLGRARS